MDQPFETLLKMAQKATFSVETAFENRGFSSMTAPKTSAILETLEDKNRCASLKGEKVAVRHDHYARKEERSPAY